MKFSKLNWFIFVVTFGLFILGAYADLPAYIYALPYYYRQISPQKYHGPGKVIKFTNQCSDTFSADECDRRIYSKVLGQKRSVIVYIPPKYETYVKPLPLLIALHGNRSNHLAFGNLLPAILDSQIQMGNIPPLVMLAPDFSLGGTGLDNPKTDYDERVGSFYINSNRGRFEDYLIQELLTWARQNYNVSDKAENTVLLGQSMGGWGAFSIGLRHPNVSTILVGIYPAVDARYSCNGDKMANYNSRCYKPITSDDPNRIVMSMFNGLYHSTERDLFYPVFDSDKDLGDVWMVDLPVWVRLKEYNPTDIIRDNRYGDISHTAMYIISGDKDEYNTDASVLSFIAVATRKGLTVSPDNPIRQGGRHTPDFVAVNMEEVLIWIGKQLRENP